MLCFLHCSSPTTCPPGGLSELPVQEANGTRCKVQMWLGLGHAECSVPCFSSDVVFLKPPCPRRPRGDISRSPFCRDTEKLWSKYILLGFPAPCALPAGQSQGAFKLGQLPHRPQMAFRFQSLSSVSVPIRCPPESTVTEPTPPPRPPPQVPLSHGHPFSFLICAETERFLLGPKFIKGVPHLEGGLRPGGRGQCRRARGFLSKVSERRLVQKPHCTLLKTPPSPLLLRFLVCMFCFGFSPCFYTKAQRRK